MAWSFRSPNASEGADRAVFQAGRAWLPCLSVQLSHFRAAAALERRACGDRFALRIDRGVADLGVLRPIRNQTPAHERDLAFAGVAVDADHWLDGLRRNVILVGQFEVVDVRPKVVRRIACLSDRR